MAAGLPVNKPHEFTQDDFELGRCVGRGAFGRVYQAKLLGHDGIVAVKELSTAGAKRKDMDRKVEEFKSESGLLAECSHRNIAQLYGVSVAPPSFYILMEWCPGGSLLEVLCQDSLSPRVIVDWALQIAQGMRYLHYECRHCIVHRDLKSANILLATVDADGHPDLNNNTLKLCDFGSARSFAETVEMTTAGTFSYMAPEVIKTSRFSRASDIWSWAVVCWELLHSEIPYAGIHMFSVAYSIGLNGCTLPVADSCPPDIAQLMRSCWQLDPKLRPDFQSVCQDLYRLKSGSFASSNNDAFFDLQEAWRSECAVKFQELRKTEGEIEAQHRALLDMQSAQKDKQEELDAREAALIARERLLLEREFRTVTAITTSPQPNISTHRRRRRSLRKSAGLSKADISEPSHFEHIQHLGFGDESPVNMAKAIRFAGETTAAASDGSRPVSADDRDTRGSGRFFRKRTSEGSSTSASSSMTRFDKSSDKRKWSLSRSHRRDSKRNSGADISGPINCVHVRSHNQGQLPFWLQLHLTRQEAELKVEGWGEGAFVVRQSTSQMDALVLTVNQPFWDDQPFFHAKITRVLDGQFRLGDTGRIAFRTLVDLVHYYTNLPYTKTPSGRPCYLQRGGLGKLDISTDQSEATLALGDDDDDNEGGDADNDDNARDAEDTALRIRRGNADNAHGADNAGGKVSLAEVIRRARTRSMASRPRSSSESQLSALDERCSAISPAGPKMASSDDHAPASQPPQASAVLPVAAYTTEALTNSAFHNPFALRRSASVEWLPELSPPNPISTTSTAEVKARRRAGKPQRRRRRGIARAQSPTDQSAKATQPVFDADLLHRTSVAMDDKSNDPPPITLQPAEVSAINTTSDSLTGPWPPPTPPLRKAPVKAMPVILVRGGGDGSSDRSSTSTNPFEDAAPVTTPVASSTPVVNSENNTSRPRSGLFSPTNPFAEHFQSDHDC
eukprot:TRINITY_DN12121_c0_g1_i2.p1 TRINITY_DN12121_c0_g1~~TRINITY_DN12121_c0_g1_i2.p1  ORF type:complete len:959 (+),score=214.42 TRINITY_DN12121_c0_g1_i2:1107-3983(+)